MIEMVERVARAIVAKINEIDGEGRQWEEGSADERAEASMIARAAIEAMREPTNDMIDALWAEEEKAQGGGCGKLMFVAAIDAALKPEPVA